MTALRQAAADIAAREGLLPRTRTVWLARIDGDGLVHVIKTRQTRASSAFSQDRYVYLSSSSERLGLVNWGTAYTYQDAESLLRACGWRRTGHWTTVGRNPACLVQRCERD